MYIQVLAVIGFVAVASAADLNVGVDGGIIIFDKNVTASPAIWRQTQNLTVNASKSDEVISRIVVIDNRPEKDGEAKIVEGGEGQKNVTIELQGPAVFRGFDFSIQVFADQENVNARAPNNPTSTGLDGQNPQVPYFKDINVNDQSKQAPKKEDGDNIILGAPKTTVTSTTEAAKAINENQDKINNPALVGQEQTRLNRDTKGQTTKQTPSTPENVTSEAVEPTKSTTIINENTNNTAQDEHDEDWKKAIDSVFANNSTQKSEDSKPIGPIQAVIPQEEIDSILSEDDDRKVRQTEKDSIVPALPKVLKGDDNLTTSTNNSTEKTEDSKPIGPVKAVIPQEKIDSVLSEDDDREVQQTEKDSIVPALPKELKGDKLTTPRSDLSTTEKSIGQENIGLGVVPVSTGTSSTAYSSKLTTESPKLPENVKTTPEFEKNLKGHHFEHQHPAVPLPYVNQ